jgi:hypothetical protein
MRKKISSKVVSTNPFIDRRVRSASKVDKCRRAEDIWNKDILSNYKGRISYMNSSKPAGDCNVERGRGRFIDFYA